MSMNKQEAKETLIAVPKALSRILYGATVIFSVAITLFKDSWFFLLPLLGLIFTSILGATFYRQMSDIAVEYACRTYKDDSMEET